MLGRIKSERRTQALSNVAGNGKLENNEER